DTPQGVVLWVNESAWRAGVRPGVRHADALSLEPSLRAGTIDEAAIAAGVDAIANLLERFSPAIEPSADMPGVFWRNGSGLELLYSSLQTWAHALHDELAGAGFHATVAVGFTRFGSYAAARTQGAAGTTVVFTSARQEQDVALRTRLERLGIEPKLRDV